MPSMSSCERRPVACVKASGERFKSVLRLPKPDVVAMLAHRQPARATGKPWIASPGWDCQTSAQCMLMLPRIC